jgi:hypothetical protein
MPGVSEMFTSVIDEMTFAINFTLINLLHMENANLTHEDLNTSIDKPENRWIIHLVLYDPLTSRAKQSTNGQLLHCSWSCWIFDAHHWDKKKNCVRWRIAMNARIGFKPQVTATPGFHSLYDWCFQTMWLFSGTPDDPEDETVMEMHGADAQYSPVKILMHAIRTEDKHAQQYAAEQMIQIAKPWRISRWSELNLVNGKPLVQIQKENAQLVDLARTEE